VLKNVVIILPPYKLFCMALLICKNEVNNKINHKKRNLYNNRLSSNGFGDGGGRLTTAETSSIASFNEDGSRRLPVR
jgi:hypothetical protein